MFSSLSSSFLWRGLLAIVVGIIAIIWPGVTVLAVVIIFAILAFGDAFMQGARAFSSDSIGPVVGHLLLALIDLAAGVAALAWPGITAWVLTIWIGAWAVVTGIIELAMAFQSSEAAGERALYGLGGILSILLGVVLFARPHLGAVALAEVFGLFSLAYGATSLVFAARTHDAGDALSHALN
jgi:uncharacterized membrane protein HdeD (DUF308 family)